MAFMKKWILRFVTEDGLEFRGHINTVSENPDDFPDTLLGEFNTFNDGSGNQGNFFLSEGVTPDSNYVVGSMFRPYKMLNQSPREYDLAFASTKPLTSWDNHIRRIEDCLDISSCYIIEF